MDAIRLEEVLNGEIDSINTEFSHINHMYTGHLSSYYYQRFDRSLEKAKISSSDCVLAVGIGTGVFALTLSELVDNLHISDIAREEPLFSTARQLFDKTTLSDDNVEYAAADATQLPYSTSSFDVIFALDVLEHIPNEHDAIQELSRVLKPGGRIVVSSPVEVGPVLLIREGYRVIDGQRHQTESFWELLSAFIGRPIAEADGEHRGYDYRQTANWLKEEFKQTSVDYCPVGPMKWLNPTAIITSQS